jgi:DNA modification methylase
MDRNSNGKRPWSEDEHQEEDARSMEYLIPPEPEEVLDIGEVDAKNWKDYKDVVTNSLWFIGSRSREGAHSGKYHGNFVPQIPYQAIRRFTKPGDVVLDTFLGSGTSLIESRKRGRHGIGIELIESIANEAEELIRAEENPYETWQEVIQGDSTNEETIDKVRQVLEMHDRRRVQLLIMHPPYHDIIKFSDNPHDLCNAHTVGDFLESFKQVVYRTYDLLEKNRFLVVVIGDKYGNSEWVPLGFRTMEAVQSVGYTLKSIVVKNMEGNRAKRNLQNLWRQRAFRGNYYIFKHEYVLFFQKTEKIVEDLKRVTELVKAIDAREELNLILDSSFATGEALGQHITAGYASISPPRILVLKHSGRISAIVINLTNVNITRSVEDDLEEFLSNLPTSVVDVSVLAEPHNKAGLLKIPGVSQVYSPDEDSLEKLAHALYIVRKATGSRQRAGRAEAIAFASALNEVLETRFKRDEDYEWRQRGKGIGFKFFKQDPDLDFDLNKEGPRNFLVGIETKWISGHEKEKAPQIRDNYYKKGFELIAVVGHNVSKWETFVKEQGNFADYYLLLSKADKKSLEEVIKNLPLLEAYGDRGLRSTELSLIDFLESKKPHFVSQFTTEIK